MSHLSVFYVVFRCDECGKEVRHAMDVYNLKRSTHDPSGYT